MALARVLCALLLAAVYAAGPHVRELPLTPYQPTSVGPGSTTTEETQMTTTTAAPTTTTTSSLASTSKTNALDDFILYPRSAINAPGKSYYVNFAVFVLPLEEVAEICLAIDTCMSFDYEYSSQVAWLHRVPPWCASKAGASFLNGSSPNTVFCLRRPEAGGYNRSACLVSPTKTSSTGISPIETVIQSLFIIASAVVGSALMAGLAIIGMRWFVRVTEGVVDAFEINAEANQAPNLNNENNNEGDNNNNQAVGGEGERDGEEEEEEGEQERDGERNGNRQVYGALYPHPHAATTTTTTTTTSLNNNNNNNNINNNYNSDGEDDQMLLDGASSGFFMPTRQLPLSLSRGHTHSRSHSRAIGAAAAAESEDEALLTGPGAPQEHSHFYNTNDEEEDEDDLPLLPRTRGSTHTAGGRGVVSGPGARRVYEDDVEMLTLAHPVHKHTPRTTTTPTTTTTTAAAAAAATAMSVAGAAGTSGVRRERVRMSEERQGQTNTESGGGVGVSVLRQHHMRTRGGATGAHEEDEESDLSEDKSLL